jgi:hypothetical protein
MLVVVLVTTIVSFADLVASLIINSLAAALMSVGLCALGLILLIIDAVRERRRLDTGSAETQQALRVETHQTAGDYLFSELEVARDIRRG